MNRCPVFRSVVLERDGFLMARAWYAKGTLNVWRFVFSDPQEDGEFQNWIDSQLCLWLLFGDLNQPPETWRFERSGEFDVEVVH